MTFTVTINGGPDNPWHAYGLRCNPFPRLGRYEHRGLERVLRELDGDPIPSQEALLKILEGCSEEFIDLCRTLFREGQRISFDVTFQEGGR